MFVWEEDLLKELMSVIEAIKLNNEIEDTWNWSYSFDGFFSSKSAYLRLLKNSQELTN